MLLHLSPLANLDIADDEVHGVEERFSHEFSGGDERTGDHGYRESRFVTAPLLND